MGTTCHALITAPGANMVPERCGLPPKHEGECKSEADVLRAKLAEVSAEAKKSVAKDMAKWIKGPVAASMFGSTTWSVRQGIARCIEDGTWCDPEINREDCGPR